MLKFKLRDPLLVKHLQGSPPSLFRGHVWAHAATHMRQGLCRGEVEVAQKVPDTVRHCLRVPLTAWDARAASALRTRAQSLRHNTATSLQRKACNKDTHTQQEKDHT